MSNDKDTTRLAADRTVVVASASATEPTVLAAAATHEEPGEDATRVMKRAAPGRSAAPDDVTRYRKTAAASNPEHVPAADATRPMGRQRAHLSLSLNTLSARSYQDGKSVSTADDLLPGAVIKQRFKLEKRIGRGGMGTIFLAKDLRKEELHDRDPFTVIKFLNEELHDSIEAIVALQREARKSQALSHPNIVTVYDFDRENDIFFLSMEYLRGESFAQYIGRGGNRTAKPAQLMTYIEFMARGLAYAHQEGFVHADFKPANVFLTEQGQVKILDFGIAQAVRSNLAHAHADDSLFDPASMGALTPNYASLEMLYQERPVPADDVYALAVVAYELLAGYSPYRVNGVRVNVRDAYDQGIHAEAIPGVSKRHMKAILKGLSYKREDRFADAGAFIDAIKPKVKMRQSALALIAVLVITMVVSWVITVNKTEAVIGFNDLPVSMAGIVDTIKMGDIVYERGDIDQAHKLYAQAWEAGFDHIRADSRDRFKLKVILDRRIDKIIRDLIARSQQQDMDEFSLMQLQVALEFLKKDDLGTIDQEIDKALISLQARLDAR